MEETQPIRGISRDEYLVAVRLCPTHPAFTGTYEDWIRATMRNIEDVLGVIARRQGIVKQIGPTSMGD
jgi:hypothetical protein